MGRKMLILLVLFLCLLNLIQHNCVADDYPYKLNNYSKLNITNASHCSYRPYGDQILFHSLNESGEKSIWLADSNAYNSTIIYSNSSIAIETSPTFNPNGDIIAFVQEFIYPENHSVEMTIELLVSNNSNWNIIDEPQEIYRTYKNTIEHLQFSPDGKNIVYYSTEGGGYGDVWIIEIHTSNRTQITYEREGGFHPTFSPDGEKIAYIRYGKNGNHELWIMNSDGTNKSRLLKEDWYVNDPSFMSNGKILFESARISPKISDVHVGYIWMIDEDGSNKTLVIPTRFADEFYNRRPISNSDSTKILFEHGFVGHSIYVVEDDDGKWDDTDNDGVADICDPYPNDPDRGYFDDDYTTIRKWCLSTIIIFIGVVIASIILNRVRRQTNFLKNRSRS